MHKIFTNIELELTEKDMLVWDAWWGQSNKPGRLVMVMNDSVVAKAPGHLWIIPYEIDANNVVSFGDPVEADITPVSEPVTNTLMDKFNKMVEKATSKLKGVLNMDREETIKKLVANDHCFLSAETLQKFDDKELKVFAEAIEEEPEAPTPDLQPPADEEQVPAWAKALQQSVETLAEAIKPIQANAEQERARLIDEIVATGQYSKDEAEELSTKHLVKVHSIIKPPVADYSGLGFAANHGGKAADVAKPRSLIQKGGE